MELSTRCQAACPMCGRNNHGGLPNPNLLLDDMSLDLFKKIVNKDVLQQVGHYCFCGNYGDPMINNDLPDICEYIKNGKAEAQVHVHTNGGARTPDWWRKLRHSLPEKHCVFFAIDGLEDTHSLYRINTQYEKVIENAKAFIDEGGTAEWVFIKFKHNSHQVEEAERRSKELGFTRFTMKNTIRFTGEEKFSVVNSKGNHLYYLEPPEDNQVTPISLDTIDDFSKNYHSYSIDCYAKKHKEVYIDVHGKLFPCCFLAQGPYLNPNDRPLISNLKEDIKKQHQSLVNDLGGEDGIDLSKRTLKEAVSDERFQTVWKKYWGEGKLLMCAKTCGKHNVSKPKEQIIKNVIHKV